jgi:hypothetical protein
MPLIISHNCNLKFLGPNSFRKGKFTNPIALRQMAFGSGINIYPTYSDFILI